MRFIKLRFRPALLRYTLSIAALLTTAIAAGELPQVVFFDVAITPPLLPDAGIQKAVDAKLAATFAAIREVKALDPASRDFSANLEAGTWPSECKDSRCRLSIASVLENISHMVEIKIVQNGDECSVVAEMSSVPDGDSLAQRRQNSACQAGALASAADRAVRSLWQEQKQFAPTVPAVVVNQSEADDSNSPTPAATDQPLPEVAQRGDGGAKRHEPSEADFRGGDASAKAADDSIDGKKKQKSISSQLGTAKTSGGGSLDPTALQAVLNRYKKSVEYCYEKNLLNNPQLKGKVEVEIDVGDGGAVSAARIVANTLKHADTEACILKQVKRWEFPAPEQPPVTVTYPFVFVKSL